MAEKGERFITPEGQAPSQGERRRLAESPKRLWRTMERLTKSVVGGIEVVGKQHIEQLPLDKKIILATTHTSDIDVPIVATALGRDLDLILTDLSIHRNVRDSLKSVDPTILGIYIAGKDNFLPIKYKQEKRQRQGQINSNDMQNVKGALDSGKAVVIAAHNTVSDGKLPDTPGYAAIRAAQLTENAVVIPIAVQIGGASEVLGLGDLKNMLKTRRRRPQAQVRIGEPLTFDNEEARQAAEAMEAVVHNHPEGQVLSEDEKLRMREAREIINKTEGAKLMTALAALLSPEKRGKWGKVTPNAANTP